MGASGGAGAAAFVDDLEQALLASKIVSYAQGYMLMREAAAEYGWRLNYGGIALMWRCGCIIRSVFLGEIKKAFDADPDLSSLLLADYFKNAVAGAQAGWRRVVSRAVKWGIPVPAMSAALAFYDGCRSARLPVNLLQAQRDYFGAHTYDRIDSPPAASFTTPTGPAPAAGTNPGCLRSLNKQKGAVSADSSHRGSLKRPLKGAGYS